MAFCGHTYETASGYILICELEDNHVGSCKGQILGSYAWFSKEYSSDEEQYLSEM